MKNMYSIPWLVIILDSQNISNGLCQTYAQLSLAVKKFWITTPTRSKAREFMLGRFVKGDGGGGGLSPGCRPVIINNRGKTSDGGIVGGED